MSEAKTPTTASAGKVLDVLNLLLRHFAIGLTAGEIAKSAGLGASDVTRYVATLVDKGFAERIPETGRIRASTRMAQAAVSILRSVEDASRRLEELKTRINRTH